MREVGPAVGDQFGSQVGRWAGPSGDTYTAVGVLDWQSQTLTVPAQNTAAQQGFLAAVALGIHHIAEGADHLLFLLMLLLPSPSPWPHWATSPCRRGSWKA